MQGLKELSSFQHNFQQKFLLIDCDKNRNKLTKIEISVDY